MIPPEPDDVFVMVPLDLIEPLAGMLRRLIDRMAEIRAVPAELDEITTALEAIVTAAENDSNHRWMRLQPPAVN